MKQTFSKKAIAASIAAALLGGSALAFAPLAVANQFEASTVNTLTPSPIRVAGSNVVVPITINESGAWSTGAVQAVTLTLSGGAVLANGLTPINLSSATSVATAVDVSTAFAAVAASGNILTAVAANSTAMAYKDAAGNTVIRLHPNVAATATNSDNTLAFSMNLLAPAGAAAGPVNVSIADGANTSAWGAAAALASPNTLGITAVSSLQIATVTPNAFIVTASTPTPTGLTGLTNQPAAMITLTAADATAAGTFDVTLSAGAFADGDVSPTANNTRCTANAVACTSAVVIAPNRMRFQIPALTAGQKVVIDQGIVVNLGQLDLTGVAAGTTITATVDSGAGTPITAFGSTTVTIETVGGVSTTVEYVDIDSNQYSKVFAGRSQQKVTDGVKITEGAVGSLTTNGTITYALSAGRFNSGTGTVDAAVALASSDGTITCATSTTATDTCAVAVSANARAATLTIPNVPNGGLDLRSATAAGDLNITVAGTAGAAGTVKLAEVLTATDTIANGPVQSLTYSVTNNQIGTLPEVVITESKVGALETGDIYLVLDDGLQFQTATLPTLRVLKADGTAVSNSSLYINPVVAFDPASGTLTGAANGKGALKITVVAKSDSVTGPLTLKVSGAQVATIITSSNQGTPIGNYALTISGNNTAGLPFASDSGAKPWKQSFPVVQVIGSNVSTLGYVTTNGPVTAMTAVGTFAPPGTVVGQQGAVYVIGYLPSQVTIAPNTYWFFDSQRNWHLAAAPVCTDSGFVPYYRGTLGNLPNIPLVTDAADLTSLIGAQVYYGYGIGGILAPQNAPCQSMLVNATYGLIYTVH